MAENGSVDARHLGAKKVVQQGDSREIIEYFEGPGMGLYDERDFREAGFGEYWHAYDGAIKEFRAEKGMPSDAPRIDHDRPHIVMAERRVITPVRPSVPLGEVLVLNPQCSVPENKRVLDYTFSFLSGFRTGRSVTELAVRKKFEYLEKLAAKYSDGLDIPDSGKLREDFRTTGLSIIGLAAKVDNLAFNDFFLKTWDESVPHFSIDYSDVEDIIRRGR